MKLPLLLIPFLLLLGCNKPAANNKADTVAEAAPEPSEPNTERVDALLRGEASASLDEPLRVAEIERLAIGVRALLNEGKFEQAEAIFASLRDQRILTTDAYHSYNLLANYVSCDADIVTALDAWIAEEPETSSPYTLKGMWATDQAWRYRGGGWASSVTESGWVGFEEQLAIARSVLLKALELNPNDYVAAAELITVSMGESSGEEPLWFERAVAINQDYFRAYSKFSVALLPRWGGDESDQFNLLEQAMARGPRMGEVVVYWLSEEREEAYKDPNTPESKKARALTEAYMEAYPDSGLGKRRMASYLKAIGHNEQALDYYRQAIELDPSANNYYALASYFYHQRNAREAVKYAQIAVEKDPVDEDNIYLLARCYHYRAYNYKKAIEQYTEYLRRNPNSVSALSKRGECWLLRGRHKEAMEDFEATLAIDPERALAHHGIGRIHIREGRYKEAAQAFRRTLECDPDMNDSVQEILDEYHIDRNGDPK